MAKYKVEIPFRINGKSYGVGDEVTLNKDAGDRHVNLGYVKEVKAAKERTATTKSTTKTAAKKASAKASEVNVKGEGDTTTIEPVTK